MAKYCYKCGAEMDEKDGFCSECGTAVVELAGKLLLQQSLFSFWSLSLS